jgi:hypothetical protein
MTTPSGRHRTSSTCKSRAFIYLSARFSFIRSSVHHCSQTKTHEEKRGADSDNLVATVYRWGMLKDEEIGSIAVRVDDIYNASFTGDNVPKFLTIKHKGTILLYFLVVWPLN